MVSLPIRSFRSLKMHNISCNSHFVVMDTEKKAEKRKENIICVHSNWVKLSTAKNGLGKSPLRDVRYVY